MPGFAGRVGWIAAYVVPHTEQMVTRSLAEKGYEAFCPTYLRKQQWSDRTKWIETPLFSRYVFCRIGSSSNGLVVTTPGVIKVLGHSGVPHIIDENDILALKSIVRSRLPTVPHCFVRVGQEVVIKSGPLAGLRGIVEQVRGGLSVIVSVTMMRRSVAVTVPTDCVFQDVLSYALAPAGQSA